VTPIEYECTAGHYNASHNGKELTRCHHVVAGKDCKAKLVRLGAGSRGPRKPKETNDAPA